MYTPQIQVYRSVYFIIFFGLHQCLVKLPELEPISPKVKRDKMRGVLRKTETINWNLSKRFRLRAGDFWHGPKVTKKPLGCPRGGLRLRCASSRSPMMDTPDPIYERVQAFWVEKVFVWSKLYPYRPIVLLDSGVTPYLVKNRVSISKKCRKYLILPK